MIQMVRHIVDTRQLKDRLFLEGLFERADEMRKIRWEKGVVDKHSNKIIAELFYEPSTRTRLTFGAAAIRLGAKIIGTENARDFSSAAKGEILEHSLRAIEESYDLLVLRHDKDGAGIRAARVAQMPIINGGDGTNQHPTQALLDLYAIRNSQKRIDGLKVALIGDVSRGRTIRSLAYLLAHLDGNCLYFVAPRELGLPDDMRSYLKHERKLDIYEIDDLDRILPEVDVAYATRLRLEYTDNHEKQRLLDAYRKFQITSERADRMKQGSVIMHPLPINTEKSDGFPEITPEVDRHSKAYYFEQSNGGLYIRMALLDILLTGHSDPLYNLILDVP